MTEVRVSWKFAVALDWTDAKLSFNEEGKQNHATIHGCIKRALTLSQAEVTLETILRLRDVSCLKAGVTNELPRILLQPPVAKVEELDRPHDPLQLSKKCRRATHHHLAEPWRTAQVGLVWGAGYELTPCRNDHDPHRSRWTNQCRADKCNHFLQSADIHHEKKCHLPLR